MTLSTRIWRRYASSSKNSAVLMRAQLDINSIISNQDQYRDSIARRQSSPAIHQNLEFVISQRRHQLALEAQVNGLRHERSKLGSLIKAAEDKDAIKTRLQAIKSELKPLESQHKELTEQIYARADSLPNLLDSSVPEDAQEGLVVEHINCSAHETFPTTAHDHKTIGERFGIMDFNQASRISGSSWYYLIGDGALLEQALVQYSLSKARKNGYTMMIPPSIVRSEVVDACGFKPNDHNGEKQVYKLEGEDTSLTGTAEIPLGAFHSSTIFEDTKFPKKYVAVSRSYRAEAGARGKDTKGLYRVHEFTKVELFHFTGTAEQAAQELEQIKDLQVEIIHELGLKAKMINMPTTDLGAPAMKKYDCEAWMPGRGNWGELTSSSNCGEYQLRRLGIRYHDGEKIKHVQTLNGTCMAVPRVIIALIEQNYDAEADCIHIPEVLRVYMDGKDRITSQSH
ncbi:seryl-tRNA synthetase [Suhomyces tanzawaensis NRRL Y-17324]|uniref:serine--tRNA ligase n=1 Tax=Suhomyces tanzawaensis NRRL Y-17324 TaxID=984487 RepID=A0A1E4SHC6_9ASCO|nr:seryl-tRNA synthetase [Suhomyces tanzawaensis NRRL Y-17324]ODV78896.1 seryl-tRNA synthetase [Suhomyces tanzawaensis NRRL Y-17324]